MTHEPSSSSSVDSHPNRRSSRVRVRALALTGILALGGGLLFRGWPPPAARAAPKGAPSSVQAITVDIVTVKAERHAFTVMGSGQLAPAEEVDIVSELPRRLVQIRAEEGASVKKGDVLFQVDGTELAARYRRLKVQRDQAHRVLHRREKLVADHRGEVTLSQHEMDVTRTDAAALTAQLQEVAAQLAKTKIRAPFDGVLGARHVSEGAWLTSDVVITTLYDTQHLKLDFELPERYAAHVAPGARFTYSVEGARGEGRVTVVEPAIERTSRSLRVRGRIEARDDLVAGSFASVAMSFAERDVLFVPTVAVEATPGGHSLWVVLDGQAQKRSVRIGERTPKGLEVVEGLKEGEQVITTNLLRLSPGAAVQATPPS